MDEPGIILKLYQSDFTLFPSSTFFLFPFCPLFSHRGECGSWPRPSSDCAAEGLDLPAKADACSIPASFIRRKRGTAGSVVQADILGSPIAPKPVLTHELWRITSWTLAATSAGGLPCQFFRCGCSFSCGAEPAAATGFRGWIPACRSRFPGRLRPATLSACLASSTVTRGGSCLNVAIRFSASWAHVPGP